MKHYYLKAFTLLSCILLGIPAHAHDFEVNGIYYGIISSSDKTCKVTYQGSYEDEYSNEYAGSIVIPETVTDYNGTTYSVTSIGEYAFKGCSGLTNIMIPNSVINIDWGAFYGCSELTNITIPNSVVNIGVDAFSGCIGLTSVKIGNSVKSINSYAFSGCKELRSITIPNSVAYIGASAFSSCSNLTSIVVESGNAKYDSRDNCNAIIETASNILITGCGNTTIPNSITSIGEYAFYGCTGLTNIEIPNSVTSIGNSAFYGCTDLTNITIPGSIITIEDAAFNGCWSLTSVIISNGVVSIGSYAFVGCTYLTSVTIGNSVTSIGDYAFLECNWLSRVTSLNTTPPTCGTSVFENAGKYEKITLEVPCESIHLYQTAYIWKDFTNIIGANDLETRIETIADDAESAEYYNLQGMRVENPEHGLYIKRQGGKSCKIVL